MARTATRRSRRCLAALGAALVLAVAASAGAADQAGGKGKAGSKGKAGQEDAEAASFGDPSEQAYLARFYLFVDSPRIEAYLRDIVRRLLAAQPAAPAKGDAAKVFRRAADAAVPDVFVYSSEEFAASTDANDNLLISTQALRDLESEDELAALLGHELGHVLLRHNQRKSTWRNFPLGVETAGWIAAAADSTQGDGRSGTATPHLSEFGKDALVNSQAVSLVWSDILMPGWNRSQERAADRAGFDLMRAAGYDPAAFGTLFSKLREAQARRSERMRALRTVAQQRVLASSAPDPRDGLAVQASDAVKSTAQTITVDALFEGITSFNRDYDPPQQRQDLLAAYAEENRLRADKRPRSPRFQQHLRDGPGGALLQADRAAIATMDALNARRTAQAQRAVAPILPRKPGAEPLSAHLNLALGAWYQASGQTASAEARVRAWIRSPRPPAQAYVWQAYIQWNRRQYAEVLRTLERGRRRVGTPAPFLPYLVSAAVANGEKGRAEDYVRECAAEDRKGPNAVVSMITFRGAAAPSGIYPECVRRLGYEPEKEGFVQRSVARPLGTGVEKFKGLFKREAKPES